MSDDAPPQSSVKAQIAARLARLSAAKQALAAERPSAPPRPRLGIQSIARRETAPLSYSQEALWQVDRMAGAHATYNVPRLMRLEGPLDLRALRNAAKLLIGRHEIFRQRYTEGPEGTPIATLAPNDTEIPF